jgi:dTDP-4-dehydrorhamnose reductase
MLIFGGDGMLGHELYLGWRRRHDVTLTFRQDESAYRGTGVFEPKHCLFGVDVRRLQDVVDVVALSQPEVVVNAVGIVKQRSSAKESIPSLEINALFPHQLARVCAAAQARVVHLSTDCVFTGQKGHYTERDTPDARDLYGMSKLLGELHEEHCLTARTSIIGLELSRKSGLVEWFLAQRGAVRGFRRAIYSGLTTMEMAMALERLLLQTPRLSGVWHLASEPITKYDLLRALAERLGRDDVEIVADDSFVCDRSLDGSALFARTSYRVPPWPVMLDGLVAAIHERKRR